MAGHGSYTSDYLRKPTDKGVLLQVEARTWELRTHLNHLIRDGKEPGGFTEYRASELDRIHAEAEMRGLL